MKPIDFVSYDGGSSPNMPAYQVAEALQKDLVILGRSCQQYEVLSYYFHEGRMYLDIQEKK